MESQCKSMYMNIKKILSKALEDLYKNQNNILSLFLFCATLLTPLMMTTESLLSKRSV